MYSLFFSNAFYRDLNKINEYIGGIQKDPIAADSITADIVEATMKLVEMPYMFPVYHPTIPRKYQYRRLRVKNYIVFYIVDESKKRVVVARAIYQKRDYEKLL